MRLTIEDGEHVDVDGGEFHGILTISVTAEGVKQEPIRLDYAEAEALAYMIFVTVKHGAR